MFDLVAELETFDRPIKTEELARLLHVSPKTVTRMATRKTLPSILLGGHRRFNPAAIRAWYQKQNPVLR